MSRLAHLCGQIWAISPCGALRHTEEAASPSWQEISLLTSPVVALTASEERAVVIAACRDGSLHLLHAESGALLATAPTPLHTVPLCLLALPAENAVFVGLQDGAVVRIHLATLAFDCMLGCGVEHSAAVNALDADDQYLYSGGEDAVVLVWDLKEATAVREISMPSAPIRSLLRVDVALWVGLENGTVEVFDIFGDDTNGIELISDKAAHSGPVTDLVKIGETEVWSLSALPDQEEVSLDHSSTLAIWDTRDLSFVISEDAQPPHARDVMSVTVVERVPYEEVTVLALSKSLGAQYISKQVKGSFPLASEEESEEDFDMYSDLDNQLLRTNGAELGSLRDDISRHLPSYEKSLQEDRHELPYPSYALSTPDALPVSEYPYEDRTPDEDDYNPEQDSTSYSTSPYLNGQDGGGVVLSRSSSGTLLTTMRRLSELLVTLLTDDVLSPSEGHTRGSSEELRAAVAKITRELNAGRQLVESCVSGNGSDNSVVTVDENDLNRHMRGEGLPCCESAVAQLRKRVEGEIENNRILRKDLTVVTKERDLLAQDLKQAKSQSENNLSSLEGLIRDNDDVTASKDALVAELQNECRLLKASSENEVNRREETEKKLRAEIKKLTATLEETSKNAEEQLNSAYDKIETKSIEIQSRRDSLRATEKQLEAMRASAQAMDRKCKSLEEKLCESLQKMEEATQDFVTKTAKKDQEHKEQLASQFREQSATLEKLQSELNKSLNQSALYRKELEMKCEESANVKTWLEQELERAKSELEDTKASAEAILTRHKSQFAQALAESKIELGRVEADQLELEKRLEEVAQRADRDAKSCEKNTVELEEKRAQIDKLATELRNAKIRSDQDSWTVDELKEEVTSLRDARLQLHQELEHRIAAADLYEKEGAEVRAVAENYKGACEELQSALNSSERDAVDLRLHVEELRDKLQRRSSPTERGGKRNDGNIDSSDMHSVSLEDSKIAVEALLASANGEIEQMSHQIEAMHRAHAEQEKELSSLRLALLSPAKGLPHRTVLDNSRNECSQEESHPATAEVESNVLVNSALQEVQEGMEATQDKLRDLSTTARKFKKSAQSHIELLPALYELEAELVRVAKDDSRDAGRLVSARGIVQSVIAQYFSSTEKRAMLDDFDETVYAPSSRRLQALQQTVAKLRAARVGSPQSVRAENSVLSATSTKPNMTVVVDMAPNPRRLLTF